MRASMPVWTLALTWLSDGATLYQLVNGPPHGVVAGLDVFNDVQATWCTGNDKYSSNNRSRQCISAHSRHQQRWAHAWGHVCVKCTWANVLPQCR